MTVKKPANPFHERISKKQYKISTTKKIEKPTRSGWFFVDAILRLARLD
jgi:hypothetical protein